MSLKRILTWLLYKKSSDDEKNEHIDDKKSKLSNEEVILDEVFYIHKEPKPVDEEINMPLEIIEHDTDPNTGGVLSYTDPNTGQTKFLSKEEAAKITKGNIPDGIKIPLLNRKNKGKNVKQPQQKVNLANKGSSAKSSESANAEPPPKIQYPPTQTAMVDGNYHIFVDLAGVKKESINVVLNGTVLIISGERDSSIDTIRKELQPSGRGRKKDPIIQSNSSIPDFLLGKFEFKYPFRRMIDESNMKAELQNGVLHITLPHRVKGDQIEVPVM